MINKLRSTIRRGFTLVETLLAIAVLAVAIVGPLTLASKGFQAALIAKDQTTAYYLAQDGVEYVRFVRDSNLLAHNADWMAGLDGTANTHTNSGGANAAYQCTNYPGLVSIRGAACRIDSLQDTTSQCGSGTGNPQTTLCTTPLNYDTSSGQYTYAPIGNSVVASIFTRSVLVHCFTSDGSCTTAPEATVLVTVQWKDIGGITRQVTASEELFNWQ